jgi:hypothetical protein
MRHQEHLRKRLSQFMKFNRTAHKRIATYALLAVPFYLMGLAGLFTAAIWGYLCALALYWAIQSATGFRRATDGLLVVSLLVLACLILLPALAKAK